jgi:hypothetical protein
MTNVNIKSILSFTPCKLAINYINNENNKSLYFMESFYKNKKYVKQFLSKIKIINKIYANRELKSITYQALGINNILSITKDIKDTKGIKDIKDTKGIKDIKDTKDKDIHIIKNTHFCYLNNKIINKMIEKTKTLKLYKKYFLIFGFPPYIK